MKKGSKLLFSSLFAIILVAICAVCFIIGRGHTIYFDNVTTEDEAYKYYENIRIYYKGEKIASMGPRERNSLAITGQKLVVKVEYQKTNSSSKVEEEITVDIPYDLDGIVLNMPALLDGADQSVYMKEFVNTGLLSNIEETEDTGSDDSSGFAE